MLDDFIKAAEQAGIPRTHDFNRGCNEGVDYFEVNQSSGWRWNTSKAFIRDHLKRENLTLRHSSQVLGLELSGNDEGALSCTGVRVADGGDERILGARREVVLAAGSIGSPQLLQVSGIGPAERLHASGVTVRHDLPGVGENLQDHLQIRSVYRVTGAKTLNTMMQTLSGKARIGLEYLFRRSGPMSMAPSQVGAFTRSSDAEPWPNIEYHVRPLSLDAFGQPLHEFPGITASVCNLNPTSRGSVRIDGADARQGTENPPRISQY